MTSISSRLYVDISKSNSSWVPAKMDALSDEEALLLAKAIKANKNLREFTLTSSDQDGSLSKIGAGYIFRALIPHKTITYIDLSGNSRVGDQFSSYIAALLIKNISLRHLNIKNCGFNNIDAKIIGKALQKNKTLTKILILMENNFSLHVSTKLVFICNQREKHEPRLEIQ